MTTEAAEMANMNRIKTARLAERMSQVDLARAVDVVRGTVAIWERGEAEPTAEMMARLVKVLPTLADAPDLAAENERLKAEADLRKDWFATEVREDLIAARNEASANLERAENAERRAEAAEAEAKRLRADVEAVIADFGAPYDQTSSAVWHLARRVRQALRGGSGQGGGS